MEYSLHKLAPLSIVAETTDMLLTAPSLDFLKCKKNKKLFLLRVLLDPDPLLNLDGLENRDGHKKSFICLMGIWPKTGYPACKFKLRLIFLRKIKK